MEIIRELVERRLRAALSVGGVAAGILVLTISGTLAEHFGAQFAGGVAYYGSVIRVTDDAGVYSGVMSSTRIPAIQAVPGVAVALPAITLMARPGSTSPIPLGPPDTVGFFDARERPYSKLKTAIATGRQLDPARQGEVVLGSGMAAELSVKVGETIGLPLKPRLANPDFVNHPFKVVGILRRTGTLPDSTASIGLIDAQMLLQESLPSSFRDRVDPSSLVSSITVYGKPGTDLDRLAEKISTTVPGVVAARPSDVVRGYDQSAQFTTAAVVAGAVAVVLGTLVVLSAMTAAGLDRTREVGLKLALGARAWHVAAEHLLEAAAIGLAGGLAGLALGAGLAWLFDLAGHSIGMDVFLLTGRLARIAIVAGLVAGLAAGVLPAIRAARLDPDRVL
jgi:putative ABC transport system permease protein